MKIQVNTDKNIEGNEDFAEVVRADIASALAKFENRLTRVEVHLGDESAGRTTGDDIRCRIEARPKGGDPVVVTHHAQTVTEARHGATDRLDALLSSMFGRLESHDRTETIRGS